MHLVHAYVLGQDSSSLRLWNLTRFVLVLFISFFVSSQNHYVPLRCGLTILLKIPN